VLLTSIVNNLLHMAGAIETAVPCSNGSFMCFCKITECVVEKSFCPELKPINRVEHTHTHKQVLAVSMTLARQTYVYLTACRGRRSKDPLLRPNLMSSLFCQGERILQRFQVTREIPKKSLTSKSTPVQVSCRGEHFTYPLYLRNMSEID
jgi:hypothetical protein